MHLIILLLLAIAAVFWTYTALQRERRRRNWAAKNTAPLYSLTDARELAVILTFAYLNQGGQPTTEQKRILIGYYEADLGFGRRDAQEMYSWASFALDTDRNYASKVAAIIEPSKANFSQAQQRSILQLFGTLTDAPTQAQTQFADAVKSAFGLDN